MFFVQSVAALPLRPVAQWGGVSAGLIGVAVVVATTLKIKRLERIRNRLKTESMQHLKGQDRLKAHMKLHELENSLENVQFYKTLGIAALAGGALVAGAGWLWPKDEDGGGESLGPSVLAPKSPTWNITGDFAIQPAVGDDQQTPVLLAGTHYMPVAVASDGDCLIHAALFREWHGRQQNKQELPAMFKVTSGKARNTRAAIVAKMQEHITTELERIGRLTLAQYEVSMRGTQNGAVYHLLKRFESAHEERRKALLGEGVSESKGGDVGEYVDDFIYDYQALTGYKYSQGNPSVLKEAAALRALLSTDEGRALWIEQLSSFSTQIQNLLGDGLLGTQNAPLLQVCVKSLAAVKKKDQGGFAAVSKFLKDNVTMTQLCAQYMDLYKQYVGLHGVQLGEVGSQHYLGGRDGELLAQVINKKIVVFQPEAVQPETWGKSLSVDVPTVFVQHVNGNHWEALVPQENAVLGDMPTGAGAGAGAGSG
jgi:hypothetical protein